jgi:hypothetical protein
MGMAAFLSREQTARKRIANSDENLIGGRRPRRDLDKATLSSAFIGYRRTARPLVTRSFPNGQRARDESSRLRC